MKEHTFKTGDTGTIVRDCRFEEVTWKKGDRFTVVEDTNKYSLRIQQTRGGKIISCLPWFHSSKYLLENGKLDGGPSKVPAEQITRLFRSYTVYKGDGAELWHDASKKTVKIKEGRKTRTVSVEHVSDLPSFVEGFFASQA